MVLELLVFGTVPTSRDCPRLLRQSQRPGTVPGFWVSEIEKYTPWCWDSGSLEQSQRPGLPEHSQSPGTVPNFKILYLLSRHHNLKKEVTIRDACASFFFSSFVYYPSSLCFFQSFSKSLNLFVHRITSAN